MNLVKCDLPFTLTLNSGTSLQKQLHIDKTWCKLMLARIVYHRSHKGAPMLHGDIVVIHTKVQSLFLSVDKHTQKYSTFTGFLGARIS